MPIRSINPATGEVVESFTPLNDPALLQKIAAAREAFLRYGEVPLQHRALCMRKLAHLLDDEAQELGELMTREMGKPIGAARAEAQKCAFACRYYADHAAELLAPELVDTGENESYVRWEPLGVVLAVMPWNFPLWQVFRFLAPCLMAGNAALLKHASNVPRCALAIEELVRRAGFPSDVFQTLLIEASQVEMVLGDERVAAVTVTGSEMTGRAIAAQAGWLIKKSVLELGGSDPFIVMAAADLQAAVEAGVKARCINNGQSCIAAKRFLISDAIYEEFEARFVAGMKSLKIGDPMLEETDIGPLATLGQVETLEQQVREAIGGGARVLTGGERIAGAGYYYRPTVITGLLRDSEVYRQEIFGPVALLFRVSGMDEAIAIANETTFGLGASVWTRDAAEAERFIAELQCGAVFVNAMVASDPRLPFGGVKHSGYGRELSAAGMREFMNAKSVVVAEAKQAAEPGRPETQEEAALAAIEAAIETESTPMAAASLVRRSRNPSRLRPRRY